MHIKTGTWESSNAACESDPLCDPAVLVSPSKPEPHIRNRRLSPGSGGCGGGGGGCSSRMDKASRQTSPSSAEGFVNGVGHAQTFISSRDRERRTSYKARSFRRDGPRPPRSDDRPSKTGLTQMQKERWVENSLSLLKPPPAFPVKDSPAKLQPAVSYASKVKAGGSLGGAEEPPGIGVLLQNQWGLSFISDGPVADEPQAGPVEGSGVHPVAGEVLVKPGQSSSESSEDLLLSCRHLEEAAHYHTQEWNTILQRQKRDPAMVVWYKDALESPA